jgi:hypothetical protein
MSTESEVRRLIRSVAASIKRGLAPPDHTVGQHARPKLESRNGYGSRGTGECSPR